MQRNRGLIQALSPHLTPLILKKSDAQAAAEQKPLLHYLIDEQLLTAEAIAKACGKHFGLPSVDLHPYYHKTLAVEKINSNYYQDYTLLPIHYENNSLTVAISDPHYFYQLDEIKFQTGYHIKPVFAPHNQLLFLINHYLSQQNNLEKSPSTASFVKQILNDAIHRNASDIHFEPQKYDYRIRIRVDGLLQEIARLPITKIAATTSYLKVAADLDIAEKRLPQDGRFSFKTPSGLSRDCRLNCCPTLLGEKLVIRLLNPNNRLLSIDELGFDETQKKQFLTALNKPQGLILVTGPTGSGKSITLYTALQFLNNIQKNISSAEDPVEIGLPGVNQVNINPKAGLDFLTILRAFLRQDPDIIMLGEIRDTETAKMAVHAAQTGHLVLATTHTNNTIETISRLTSMGIKPFHIANCVQLIIAQRLVRKRCPHCTQDSTCPHCNDGYHGRTAVFEMMPLCASLRHLILKEQPISNKTIGIQTLWQSAMKKIEQGTTTLDEVQRVIQEDESE